MNWVKVKKAIHIIRKEGFDGILNIFYKLTKNTDKRIKTSEAIALIEKIDCPANDLEQNRLLMSEFGKRRPEVKSINWFIPHFIHAHFGGIYTILRFANFLADKKEVKTRLIIYDNPYVSESDVRNNLLKVFPKLAEAEISIYKGPDVNVIPYADISVATLWTSAYQVMKFRNTREKFYFIQDYEPLFYPAGSYYALAEATYRFGFHGIVNTPGLHEFVTKTHGMQAEYFIPAIDRHIFFPQEGKRNDQKIKLFFYGRPFHDRNAFELAIATAKKLKSLLGNKIEIVSAGSDWKEKKYGVDGIVKNLGLLSYQETGELYRTCHFGLVLMFTKHPSYIPMELMSSGAIVVTNYNQANTWLFKDQVNCAVVEPFPTYIAEKLIALINDPKLQNSIRANALIPFPGLDWESQMEKIHRFITGKNS